MKAFQFLLGLAILVFVLLVVSAPVNADAKSLVGGWYPYTGCLACETTRNDDCSNGQVTGYMDCDPGAFVILIVPGNLMGTFYPPPVCTGPGACGGMCNSVCGI
jgi:hypothetical protein